MESSASISNAHSVEYRSEIINEDDLISKLPEEVLLHILSFLTCSQLTRSSKVSKRWARLILDPALWDLVIKKLPSLTIFNAANWSEKIDLAAYNISVEGEPPFHCCSFTPFLDERLASLPIEGDAGVTILTIPKKLSMTKLREIEGKIEKNVSSTLCGSLRDLFDIETDKTYRILITNNILKNSKGLKLSEIENLLKQYGCRRPKMIEILALLITTFISTQQVLYYETFTQCDEQVSSDHSLVKNTEKKDHFSFNIDPSSIGVAGVL